MIASRHRKGCVHFKPIHACCGSSYPQRHLENCANFTASKRECCGVWSFKAHRRDCPNKKTTYDPARTPHDVERDVCKSCWWPKDNHRKWCRRIGGIPNLPKKAPSLQHLICDLGHRFTTNLTLEFARCPICKSVTLQSDQEPAVTIIQEPEDENLPRLP